MGNSLYKAVIETRQKPVPFTCPPWAYQWASPGDFEPAGSHRRIRDIRRPENFDAPSRGKGRDSSPAVPGLSPQPLAL